MVGFPFIVGHSFEGMRGPGPFSDFVEDSLHAVGDFVVVAVEDEGVLREGLGEGAGGRGGDVVGIKGEADGVVDGDDVSLIKLAPVLD